MYYWNRIKQLFILTALTVFVLLSGCVPAEQEAVVPQKELVEATPDLPQLIEVTRGEINKSDYYDGEINPFMQVLQFPRKGVFLEYRALLGDSVEKGRVLAVTQPEYEQQIEDLTEQIETMRTDYNNTVTNYDLELTTHGWRAGQLREVIEMMPSEAEGFDDICISYEMMLSEGEKVKVRKKQYIETMDKELAFQEAKLARLKEKNESNIIVAPANGVITYLADLQVGDGIGVTSYPVVLADTDKFVVQCEYIKAEKMEGMEFSYAVKDGKRYELQYIPYEKGEYERKRAKGEGVYTYFEVLNPDDSIEFGEDIKIITVEEHLEDVLVVPSDSVRTKEGKPFVYIDNNGKKEAVLIEIGSKDDLYTEVLSGLQEGDMIYAAN